MSLFDKIMKFAQGQQRVAKKMGVDATFVSRVARGERKSEAVMAALMEELDTIRDYLNRMPEH